MKRALLLVMALCLAVTPSLAATTDRQPVPEPAPLYEVRTDKSVMIPMRDGVHLSTDLYFPRSEQRKWPVILIRTPYSKTGLGGRSERLAAMMAGQGYVVAVQDKR